MGARLSPSFASGGRARARRMVLFAALILWSAGAAPVVATSDPDTTDVAVRAEKGVYTVSARFQVAQSPSVVVTVLTDYENIPQFMPDVRTSIVRERDSGRAVVEQEAAPRFMMVSKRVHLVLDVREQGGVITFRDRCGRSFARYEGRGGMRGDEEGTEITYDLVAEPSFDVPEFILKRLLRRDAGRMIEGLRKELARRG